MKIECTCHTIITSFREIRQIWRANLRTSQQRPSLSQKPNGEGSCTTRMHWPLSRTKKHILLVKLSMLLQKCFACTPQNAIKISNTKNMFFFSNSCSIVARTNCGEREHTPNISLTMLETRATSCFNPFVWQSIYFCFSLFCVFIFWFGCFQIQYQ